MSLRASSAAPDLGPAPTGVRPLAVVSPTPVSVPPLASSPVAPFVPFVPQHAPARATDAQGSVLALFDKLTVAPTGAPEDKRSAPDSPEASPNSRSKDNKAQRTDPSDLDVQFEARMQTLQAIMNKVKTHGYDKKDGYPTKKSVTDELKVVNEVAEWKLAYARSHPRVSEMGLLVSDLRDEFKVLEGNRASVNAAEAANKKAIERKRDDEDMMRLELSYEGLLEWRAFIKTADGKKDVKEMEKRGFATPKQLKDYREWEASEDGQRALAEQAAVAAAAKAEGAARAAKEKEDAKAAAKAAKSAATAAKSQFKKAKAAHDKQVVAERQRLLGLLQPKGDPPVGEEFKKLERDLGALHSTEVDFLDAAEQAGNLTEAEFTEALQLASRDAAHERDLLEAARAEGADKLREEREAAENARLLARSGEDREAMEKLYRLRHQLFVEMCLRAQALRASLVAPGGRVDQEGNSLVPEWVSEMIDRMCDERDRPLEDDPDGQKPDPYTNTNYEMFENEFQEAGYADIDAANSGGAMGMDTDDDDEDGGGVRSAADMTSGGWMQDDGDDPDEVILNKQGNPMFDADDEDDAKAAATEEAIRPLHMRFTIRNLPAIRIDSYASEQKNQQKFIESEVYNALNKWITTLGFSDEEEPRYMALDQARAEGIERLDIVPITVDRSGISVVSITPHVGANGPTVVVDASAEMQPFDYSPGVASEASGWKPDRQAMDEEEEEDGEEEDGDGEEDDEDGEEDVEMSEADEADLFNETLHASITKLLKGMTRDEWERIFLDKSNLLSESDTLGRVATFESALIEPPLNVTLQEMAQIRKADDDYLRKHPEYDESSRFENASYNTQYAIVMALRQTNKLAAATAGVKENEGAVRAEYAKSNIKMDNPDFVAPSNDEDREGEAEAEELDESEDEESSAAKQPKKKKKKKKKRVVDSSDDEGSSP